MKSKLIFIASLVCMFFSANVISADITATVNHYGVKQIVIEGGIIKGDYEKFMEAVLKSGYDTKGVLIASSGGSVDEAMKIGRLIRALKFSTNGPFGDINEPLCYPVLKNKANCVCMSSCVLIWLSGVHRYGDHLSIHRFVINRNHLKGLSMNKAAFAAKLIKKETDKYMLEMDTPKDLIERIDNIPSNRMETLDEEYIDKNLDGYSKSYQEWLVSKCGDESKLVELHNNSENNKKGEIFELIYPIHKCKDDAVYKEKVKAYYPAIKEGMKVMDRQFVSKDSLTYSLFSDLLPE
jgi:hypothetical protein